MWEPGGNAVRVPSRVAAFVSMFSNFVFDFNFFQSEFCELKLH